MSTLKDGTALYEVERRVRYAERPGFRITELQIGPIQEIPWHSHNEAQDTFYVLEGRSSSPCVSRRRGCGCGPERSTPYFPVVLIG